jgi:hypothetical protein
VISPPAAWDSELCPVPATVDAMPVGMGVNPQDRRIKTSTPHKAFATERLLQLGPLFIERIQCPPAIMFSPEKIINILP